MYRNAKLNLENENQQLILTKEDCHVISSVMGNSYVETNSYKKYGSPLIIYIYGQRFNIFLLVNSKNHLLLTKNLLKQCKPDLYYYQ